ncbi:MAG: hypothetical protein LBL97_05015 [Prevotellaceae bacterium]|nr:hypothetical protein [Prevotellaceae bacterium]
MDIPNGVTIDTRAVADTEAEVVDVTALVFDSGDKLISRIPYVILDKTNQKVTIKLKRSTGTTDTYRVVLLANCKSVVAADLSSASPVITTGASYADIAAGLRYELNSGVAFTLSGTQGIPMWGETNPLVVVPNMSTIDVLMMRTMARIDLGINFTNTTNGSEAVVGIGDYQLKSVQVYNRMLQGTIIPDKDSLSVVSGNIVADGVSMPEDLRKETPDGNPVSYTVNGNLCVHTIYIPEALADGNNNNPVMLVAGISLAGGATTYYRIDFANTNETNRFSIVRNHRYIFNIKRITGPGYATADLAAASEPANCEWTGVDLDVNMDDEGGYISGNYYFRCPTSTDIAGEPFAIDTLVYETNIPNFNANMIRWANSTEANPGGGDVMNFALDTDNKTIIFTAKEKAADNKTVYDMYIKADPIPEFNIHINRRAKLLRYQVVGYKVEGVYLPHFTQSPNSFLNADGQFELSKSTKNKMVLTVRTLPTIDENGEFEFSFNEINNYTFELPSGRKISSWPMTQTSVNGITYNEYTVELQGKGTPENAEYDDFTLTAKGYKLDSSTDMVVYEDPFEVRVGYAPKTILSAASGADLGFTDGAGLLVNSKRNYGMSGTVPIESLKATQYNAVTMTTFLSNVEKAQPDIVMLEGSYTVAAAEATTLAAFCNGTSPFTKKGVLVVLADGYTSGAYNSVAGTLLKALFPGTSPAANVSATNIGKPGSIFTLPAAGSTNAFLPGANDLIINGLFGSMWGLPWGKAGANALGIKGLENAPIKVYTRSVDGSTTKTDNITMFRYGQNLLFIGDGGFMAQPKRVEGSATTYPFQLTRQYQPAANTKYSSTVYNAHIMANILFWAIHIAECQDIPEYIAYE